MFRKSEALGAILYIPNVTFGGFSYKKMIPFQMTMGFLSENVSRQDSENLQELNDFFYIGPQYIKKYRLFSRVYSELGLAVLTGNLNYRSTQANSSSYREGMFFGIQPKIKLLMNLSKNLNLVFDFHYILTSSNLDNEAAEIGPSLGAGLRYDLHFSLR